MASKNMLLLPALVAAYDQSKAIQYAKLSGAAYCADSALKSWTCGEKCIDGVSDVQVCTGATTKAFAAKWEGTCVLSFEGTSNIKSTIQDLQALKSSTSWNGCTDCMVHAGFLAEWQSHETCIKTSLANLGCPSGSSLRVTGHSLGAAVSSIAMVDLASQGWQISEAYNFGMPRAGDQKFTQAFNAQFSSIFSRVTHHMDPIVHLPPKNELVVDWHFDHVEPEVFYKGAVSEGSVVCNEPDDKNCSGQYASLLLDQFMLPDHLDYMGEDTSIFGCSGGEVVVV